MTRKPTAAPIAPALPSEGGSTVLARDGSVLSRSGTVLPDPTQPDPTQPDLEPASKPSQTAGEPASKEN